jgi:queuosine precursor transporter
MNTQTASFSINKAHLLFIVLGGFFVSNALIAEFIGIKVFSLEKTLGFEPVKWYLFNSEFSFNLSAGTLTWPVVFIMTDIINEYFGRRGVKILSYMTVLLIGYASISLFLTIQLVPADFWIMRTTAAGDTINMHLAFNAVLGQGLWITIASLTAFLIGQLIDISIFSSVKRLTGERLLWLRATGSTVVSQLADSFIVSFIALRLNPDTQWEFKVIIPMLLISYSYKLIMAILLTPVIYLIHSGIERYLGESLATELKVHALTSK